MMLFEPTPKGLREWLDTLSLDDRVAVCEFMAAAREGARTTASQVLDETFAQMAETSTYRAVAERYEVSIGTAKKRINRHHTRTDTTRTRRLPTAAEIQNGGKDSPTVG